MSDLVRDRLDLMPPASLRNIRVRSLVIGGVAFVIALVGGFLAHDPVQFHRSYLLAWEMWNNVSLGCLAILMMQHLTGGRWAFVIRRPLEAATRLFPLMAILGLPVLIGISHLYPWADPAIRSHDEHLSHNVYLTTSGFVYRYIVYFFAWITLAWFMNKYSARQDTLDNRLAKQRLENAAGPGLAIYVLTATFSSIDWLMSLTPHWSSTIYGFLLIAGQGLIAIAFMIAVLVILQKYPPMNAILQPRHFHDLGKLMLTFVMLWAYFSFSQLLLVWSGNLPEEISWYLHRLVGGWKLVDLALILLHFALPFVLLLSRDLKRSARPLAIMAVFIIVMRFVDLFWLIAPNPLPGKPNGTTLSWLDIAFTIGIGGIWMGAYFWQLSKRPLVPLYDPTYEEVVGHAGTP
jgi:hypothetical protein